MPWFPESKDHLPLTWWKGTPIFLAGVIAIGAVGCMVLTAVLMGVFGGELVMNLAFSPSGLIQEYRVWTLLTYPLINPPSIWLLVGCYMLYNFGSEVEKHLGRNVFVQLLLWIMFSIPLLQVALLFAFGMNGSLMGIYGIQFGVFLAFATLYPRAQISIIICSVEVWIVATAIVGIGVLSALAGRQWGWLIEVIATAMVPYAFIRYQQGRQIFPFLSNWWSEKKSGLKVVRGPKPKPAVSKPTVDPRAEVDAILEKIARDGMSSLTEAEKAKLEEASKRMKGKRG